MVEKTIVIKAIQEFVSDLSETFPQNRDLNVYSRLVKHLRPDNHQSIARIIENFGNFCQKYDSILSNSISSIPDSEKIAYSERICLPIGKVIAKASNSEKEVIRSHLLTISACLDGNTEKLKTSLPNYDSNSKEAQFTSSIMSTIEQTAHSSNGNMGEAFTSLLMPGGPLTQMMTGMQTGELDHRQLLRTFSGVLNNLASSIPENPSSNSSETPELSLADAMKPPKSPETKKKKGD